MKILLTGAHGFIGRVLLKYLPALDCTVETWNQALDGSLLSKFDRERKLESFNCEVVVHLAWNAISDNNYHLNPANLDFAKATIDFRNQIIERGSRFLSIGSVYEKFPNDPKNLYQHAKKDISASFSIENFRNTTWVTPSYIFSFSEKRPRVIQAKVMNSELILNNPTQSCDWIEVRDVASAIWKLTKFKVDGTVDLHSGLVLTVHDFLKEFDRVNQDYTNVENLDGSLVELSGATWKYDWNKLIMESSTITSQYLRFQSFDTST